VIKPFSTQASTAAAENMAQVWPQVQCQLLVGS